MRKTLTDKGVAALKPRAETLRLSRPRTRRALRPHHPERRQVIRHRCPRPGRQAGLDHDRRDRPHDHRDRARDWRARRSRASAPGCRRSSRRAKPSATWSPTGSRATSSATACARAMRSCACSIAISFRRGVTANSSRSGAATSPPCSTRSRTATARDKPTTASTSCAAS